MPPLRPFLLTAAALALLAALAVAVVLAPPVQQWAVRRALAGYPDLRVDFTGLAFGLARGEVRDLELVRGGVRMRVAGLELDYGLLAFLGRREVELRRVAIEGLELDLSADSSPGAGAAGAPVAFASVRLPWGLVLGDLRATGRVLLPGPPGQSPVVAQVGLSGGGLAPGREGRFALEAKVEDATPGARVRALRTSGELRLRQAADHGFDLAALVATVDAEGARLAGAQRLRVDAGLRTAGASASYALRVDTQAGTVTSPLLAVEAEAPTRGGRFSGRWNLRASRSQVEPFLLGGALPDFTFAGDGKLTLDPAARALGLAGRLEGEIDALETLDPVLRALGRLRLRADFDGAMAPGRVRLARMGLEVANDAPILEARLARGLAVDLNSGAVEMAAGDGEIGRVRLAGVPVAWIRPLLRGVDLAGGAVTGEIVASGSSDEIVLRTIAPVRVRGVSAAREGAVIFRAGDLAGAGSLKSRPDGLQAELTELSLDTPEGDRVRLRGSALLPRTAGAAAVVRLDGDATLVRLPAPLVPIGTVRVTGQVEASLAPDRLELRSLRGALADGRGRQWVSGELSHPVAFDLPSGRPSGLGPEEVPVGRLALATIRLDEVALLLGWAPLAGEVAPVVFALAARDGRLSVRAEAPWRVEGFDWGAAGARRPAGWRVRATPTLEFGGVADWRWTDGGSVVEGSGGGALAEAKVEVVAGRDGRRATAMFQADLAALGRQPAGGALAALGAGRAEGEWRALGDAAGWQVEGRTTLNGLVLRDGNRALPVANLSLRAVHEPSGRTTVEVPLLLDRVGQRTDLRLRAEVAPDASGRSFDARLTGKQVELGDVLVLAALARGPAPGEPPEATGAPAGPDLAPPWAGWRGRLRVDVKSLAQAREWRARGLEAELTVAPAEIRLERAAAIWDPQGSFAAQGALAFRGGSRPYDLEGDFTVRELDLGVWLQALEPGRAPVVEGRFTTIGRLAGAGRTLDETLAGLRGEFELRSRQGVFRGLRGASERVSAASWAVDAVAALGSILGSERVKEAAEKVAGQAYQVDQLAQALAELPFDQFVLRARREQSLDLRIEELSLLSPEVRLSARGVATHAAARSFLEQPLNLTCQLAVRGRVEQILLRLRALDGTKDELGFSRVKDAGVIGGTVGRPRPDALFLRLAEAKLGDLLK